MNNWTVLLQLEGASGRVAPWCTRYGVSGAVLPAQILVIACDPTAESSAQAVHSEIRTRLLQLCSSYDDCGGPRGLGCTAWREPSCRHILVPMIGSTPLNARYENLAYHWLQKSGFKGIVIPALVGPIGHAQVFGGNAYPTLSRCNAAAWGGSPSRLADIILSMALIDEKPGVFLSYLRKEASAGAEQIHDALIRAGFRVFLDRFSGTPGRLFPYELAEAMANMGLVVLLETKSLRNSIWTMWEAAFAHRYRIGPIAVNFSGVAGLRFVSTRLTVKGDPAQALPDAAVDRILKFVQKEYLGVAVSRRAYYETLIRLAAQSKRGDARTVGPGVLEILDHSSNIKGYALPSGAPGQLKHVRHLVQTATSGRSMLAGEHQHLSPSDRADLEWLATQENMELAGSASIYRMVRSIM